MPHGPGFREIAFDVVRHGTRCRCGLNLTTLDGGSPAISVFEDEETGEITCGIACAADVANERRAYEDAEAGRHDLLKEAG